MEVTAPPTGNPAPYGWSWSHHSSCGDCLNTNTGSQCDVSWNNPLSQQHLTTGNQPSWTTWLANRANGYNNSGCPHFQNAINWISAQLQPTANCPNGGNSQGNCWNNIQIARKNEKIAWAQAMLSSPCCSTLEEATGMLYEKPKCSPDNNVGAQGGQNHVDCGGGGKTCKKDAMGG